MNCEQGAHQVSQRARRTLIGHVLGLVLCVVAAQVTAEDLDNRFANVSRLVEESSGARRVDGSGNSEALARREQARALLLQARTARDAGDSARASELLGEASRSMFDAVRLAGTPDSITRKDDSDFDDRVRSIEALTAALERITAEKGSEVSSDVVPKVKTLLARGIALRDGGDTPGGRKVLDEAYEQAKRGVEELRGGETLVRTLKFASKEEEYRYELDRNDTHRMLVEVLVSEKRTQASIDQMVTKFSDNAAKLRAEAERQAGGGNFADAVTTLENSTKEYIRAIRSSGIYIPG
jgi:hypothetical protein